MFERGKEYLQKALAVSQVPNTMLFFGPDPLHLKRNAMELGSALLGCSLGRLENNNHLDFHAILPEGKNSLHSIESIRSAIENSHVAPFEASAKIFFIESAERMQPAAANALLKTLEEPTLDSYWILLSTKPQEILPTILSRCIQLSFTTEDGICVVKNEETELLLSLLAERPTYPKLSLGLEKLEKKIEGEESQRKALQLFTQIALYFREEERKGIISGEETFYNWEAPLQKAVLAFERNIKLSACLEVFFFRVYTRST